MRHMPTRTKPIIVDSPPLEPIEPIKPPVETVTFRATHFYAVLVVVALATGILIGYMAWGRTPTPQAVVAQPAQPSGPLAAAPLAVTPTPQYVRYTIPSDGFPSIGPANAPITIVEFGDFQCPFCRQWQQDTYQPLLAAYPGKIRLVYRDFPLTSIHPNAFPAAEAAQCANEQNSFWPYHDKLFSSENLSDDIYKQYAQELNLDMTKFNTCLTNHTYDKYIQANSDFAVKTGVDSTPTFFINGLALIGAQPIDAFKQVIDKELAHEIP
jgi:protein-disulfide isomerase